MFSLYTCNWLSVGELLLESTVIVMKLVPRRSLKNVAYFLRTRVLCDAKRLITQVGSCNFQSFSFSPSIATIVAAC